MKVTPTAIPEVLIIEPKVFGDTGGFFYESFNQKAFNEATGTNCRIPDDCIDEKRYPLFMARAVIKELIELLQSTGSEKSC